MQVERKAAPDFEELEKVIKGEQKPCRVHLVELGIDQEVVRFVTESVFTETWIPNTEQTRSQYARHYLDSYARMGYDFAPAWAQFANVPQFKERKAVDTAELSRGRRHWVEEGGGIIKDWNDFERSWMEWSTAGLPVEGGTSVRAPMGKGSGRGIRAYPAAG